MVIHNNTNDFIYPVKRNQLVVRLKASKGNYTSCSIQYWNRTTPEKRNEMQMNLFATDECMDIFEGKITFSQIARYQKYYFKLIDAKGTVTYVSSIGEMKDEPRDGFYEFLYANPNDCIVTPDWAKGCVYYQIFPERFYNGDTKNDPSETEAWGTKPSRDNYMGGDLAGIIEKIPYLKELGIECLYLNPIFKSDFNHKYATADYFTVDPVFGTNDDLGLLVKKCHEANIKILLDGVFNHVGVHFEQFEDVLLNGDKSRFKDWFFINNYPVNITHHDYECVGAYKYMPKLNTANPEVREFVLKVMEFWIKKYNIDGWRLDVADEVDGSVWSVARLLLKKKYPETLLLGETWGNGGNLLDGHKMDCVMNYCFRDAVKDYFGKKTISLKDFDERINHMIGLTRSVTNNVQYNLIDSHDTERFLFYCDEKKDRLKLAALFQMLFIGAPAIYYGDEVGMTGDNDPDCRRCMIWDEKVDKNLLEFYKEIIALRKKEKAIRLGDFKVIARKDNEGIYAFERAYENEKVVAVFSESSEGVTINAEEYFIGDMTEFEVIFEIRLSEGSVIVIKQK